MNSPPLHRLFIASLAILLVHSHGLWAGVPLPPKPTPATIGENHSTMQGHQLRPLWIISDFRLPPQSGWNAGEAQKWLFKSLEISPERIEFNGEECQPHMTTTIISLDELIRWAGGLTMKDLKIPEGSLQLITTGCRIEALKQYVRIPDRRLLIQFDKVIFILEPNVNY